MKVGILNIIIPIIAVFVATIIAITLQSTEKDTLPMGYIEGSLPPCSVSIQCSDNIGKLCTIKINDTLRQAFGKNSPFPTDCIKVLYKP